ncbi:hypothetical protein [Daejeonella sp.]|uniref:hypothetical protein n=1 Tax=Daejeonella sp. TaxID=2805397 RepID=UPI0030BA899D
MKRIDHTSSAENIFGMLFSIMIGFAVILFNAERTKADNTQSLAPVGFNSDRIRVQQIYTSQIGIREKGINAGADVEKYLLYVNLPKDNPWCAAFVCWVFGQAGAPNPRSGWSPDLFRASNVIWPIKLLQGSSYGKSGKLQRIENGKLKIENGLAEKESGKVESAKPEGLNTLPTFNFQFSTFNSPGTGDVFGLFFPEKARIAHVGFIDQWDGTWMISVEGNTNNFGSREGDGVYRKRRLVKSIYKVARYVGVIEN